MLRPAATAAACSLALLTTAACGTEEDATTGGGSVEVVASFYPIEYATQQIGGEHVDVTSLTEAGAEPHDVELTPKQVLETTQADSFIHLSQFSPAIDDAAQEAGGTAFDVRGHARLGPSPAEHDYEGEGHDGHAHEGHDHGGANPHFWLDPTRYADVGEAIADELAKVDPAHAEDYREGAKAFDRRLTSLDRDLREGLADCRETDLVTGHAAFTYFADRYGFEQVGIAGLTPHNEPSPSQLADLIAHVKEAEVDTVYAETLVPSDVADTIARDGGADVETLDPVAGITDASAGEDYFEIMRSNLETLREGQGCR